MTFQRDLFGVSLLFLYCINKPTYKVMKIKLHGIISDEESKKWDLLWSDESSLITFKDIDEALANKPKVDKLIELDINCPGGNVIEGLAIFDKLRSMEGCTIVSNAIGECSSMATVIYLAASRRISQPNARFCIHKPRYTDVYQSQMTEDDAKRMYDDLHAETERFIKIYEDRINLSSEEIESLMKEDRYISADEALSIGLVTEIAQPMTAVKYKPNTDSRMTKKLIKALRAFKEALGEKTDETSVVAMTLNTEDGSTIEVEREEGDPQVGDVASPDGEHLMSDGTTIVIADGVITEIRPADEQGDTEDTMSDEEIAEAVTAMTETIESLTAENESLKKQLEDSKANQKTDDEVEILQLVANAGGMKWLKSQKTSFKPAPRQAPKARMSADDERQNLLQEAREKYEKKKP